MFYRLLLSFVLIAAVAKQTVAQPVEQIVKVIVAPDHKDWLYKIGEKVKFTISVLQFGNPVKGAKVRYEIGPERMDPTKKDSLTLSDANFSVDGGTMKAAGFLRCIVYAEVDGKQYRNLATAGFEPTVIKPAIENPADFLQFWEQAKAELAKIPLDTRMTLMPERCTEKVNVYHVNLQNYRLGTRLDGILCVPKKKVNTLQY